MKLQYCVYAGVLIFSAIFLFVGNRLVSVPPANGYNGYEALTMHSATVTEIIYRDETIHDFGDGFVVADVRVDFNAVVNFGTLIQRNFVVVSAVQNISGHLLDDDREVAVGNRIILFYNQFAEEYHFVNFVRIHYVLVLAIIFFGLMVLFGKSKGLNALVSLGFICAAIFLVFIPAVLSGRNIYFTTAIICAYAIVSTLLIVLGPTKKALTSILGCFGGVLLAGVLTRAMDSIMVLSGFIDNEHRFLAALHYIDLRAVVFAGVTIGVLGAVMDVALSISSALWEVKETGGDLDFNDIFTSGINIGKDIVGTMLNTLVLAYIGSSLATLLLIASSSPSYLELFNLEMVLVELLRTLAGSFGLLFTIPLTAGICAWLYTRESEFGS